MQLNSKRKRPITATKLFFNPPFWKVFCNRLASFCNRLPVKKTNHPNAVIRLKVNVDGDKCIVLVKKYHEKVKQLNQKHCITRNIRVQEIFANFAIISQISRISWDSRSFSARKYLLLVPSYLLGPPLPQNSRDFPVAKLPKVQIRENFMSRNFPVIQYIYLTIFLAFVITSVWA